MFCYVCQFYINIPIDSIMMCANFTYYSQWFDHDVCQFKI